MGNLKEGFRFRPTDREGLTFLLRFIRDNSQYSFFMKKNKSMYHRNVGNNRSWKQQDRGKAVRTGVRALYGYDCRDYVLCAIKKRTILLDNIPEETDNNLKHETTAFLRLWNRLVIMSHYREC
ncbi:hypothetical protein HAX54_052519 [Datura stramonium]|uniref:Uncharacterized protein n=1 Tax=Datura stramonium TaxID=4076 RepID=A0ABS8SZP3_DATST|nr:hypothetical protein [Datura stramonium]